MPIISSILINAYMFSQQNYLYEDLYQQKKYIMQHVSKNFNNKIEVN